jgi:hypothetical protein
LAQTDTKSRKYDDLTVIHGIGSSTQYWLRQTLGVRTYHDLALLSADEIETQMKEDGKIISRGKIESWLTQAAELAVPVAVPTQAEYLIESERDGWKTMATFVVVFEERENDDQTVFRTKAHHMEADETEVWDMIEKDALSQWMISQLGLKVLDTLQTPLDQVVAFQESQPIFGDKLQQFIAKTRTLSGESVPQQATRTQATAAQSAYLTSQMMSAEDAQTLPASPPSSPFSGKMQHLIAKAQQLSGK